MRERGTAASTLLEAIRRRPAMYVGDNGSNGLHHLVRWVVGHAVAVSPAGHHSSIEVRIAADGETITVRYPGCDAPGVHAADHWLPLLGSSWDVLGTDHESLDVTFVCALSAAFTIRVCRDGAVYEQRFACGVPEGDSERIADAAASGTTISFRADPTIFETTRLDDARILAWLHEMAALHAGLECWFRSEGSGREETACCPGGIVGYRAHLNREQTGHCPAAPFACSGEHEGVGIDVALQYVDRPQPMLLSFANDLNTADGGAHLDAFRATLTAELKAYARETDLLNEGEDALLGGDLRRGLTAIVRVRVARIIVESATRTILRGPEAAGAVAAVFGPAFRQRLRAHPDLARRILAPALEARQRRPPWLRRIPGLADAPVPRRPLPEVAFRIAVREWRRDEEDDTWNGEQRAAGEMNRLHPHVPLSECRQAADRAFDLLVGARDLVQDEGEDTEVLQRLWAGAYGDDRDLVRRLQWSHPWFARPTCRRALHWAFYWHHLR